MLRLRRRVEESILVRTRGGELLRIQVLEISPGGVVVGLQGDREAFHIVRAELVAPPAPLPVRAE